MRSATLLLLAGLAAAPLSAQSRLGPVEKRPKLQAGADTNDAAAYFAHAQRKLREDPGEASAAFYWAARLDPGSAEALDGRRATMIMRKSALSHLYFNGGRKARANKELRAIDSLQLRALRLDPLYYRKYDHAIIMDYLRTEVRRANPGESDREIDFAIRSYLTSGSDYMRGWVAYAEGRMGEASQSFERAMKKVKNPGYLRIERARVMALQGFYPMAVQEFALASADLQKLEDDKDEDVVFYNSKAMIEHSRGVLYVQMKQSDSAKVALGRAITEDLSYFAAHLELGRLALREKDTTTALSEMALAAELAADEPIVHYLHGSTLLDAGQPAEAVVALQKAVELEPMHAGSHFVLARALEASARPVEAHAHFTKYMALAPWRDQERRAVAKERLAALAK